MPTMVVPYVGAMREIPEKLRAMCFASAPKDCECLMCRAADELERLRHCRAVDAAALSDVKQTVAFLARQLDIQHPTMYAPKKLVPIRG